MAVVGRTREELRSALLSDWATRLGVLGFTLDTTEGSPEYAEADALAVDLLALEGAREVIAAEVIPSTASADTNDRRGRILGLSREEGIPWTGSVTVTGADGAHEIGSSVLLASGRRYVPASSSVTLSSGTGTLNVQAAEDGSEYVLEVGDTVQWDAAPVGLNPTATVASSTVDTGTNQEGDADFALRVETNLRARPAGGNPPHYAQLAEAHEDVAKAFVYPCLAPDSSAGVAAYSPTDLDTPGCITILVAGPAQGLSASNTRLLTTEQLADVAAYFAGTKDAAGAAVVGGSRLYSAQLNPADFAVELPAFQGQSIDVTVTNDTTTYPLPWTGSMVIHPASTSTSLVVNGDHTAKNSKAAAVQLDTGAGVRGRVQQITLPPTSSYDGVKTTWTLSTALLGTPLAGGYVDPAPGNWDYLKIAIFDLFDGMGPGDVPSKLDVAPPSGLTRRRRFPPLTWESRGDLDPSDLIGALAGAAGVLDATVTSPASLSSANPKQWYVLDLMRIRFA